MKEKVYAFLETIPKGKVVTYGQIGEFLGNMNMEVNTTITDSDIQENWEQFKTSMEKDTQEFNKDGVSLTVQVNDQNYEYDTILDIDVENASEEILKDQGFSDLKNDTSTLEVSKEEAEKDGSICEIK